jgi:uncharacterized protein (TIGR02271 family)
MASLMRDERTADETVIPVIEEQVRIDKRLVETGRVRVRTVVEEREELVRDALSRDEVEIVRVAIDREVEVAPQVRHEGDTLIVPVVEEVIVVEKRLVLREEIHLRRRTTVEPVEAPVKVRSTRAHVERIAPGGDA